MSDSLATRIGIVVLEELKQHWGILPCANALYAAINSEIQKPCRNLVGTKWFRTASVAASLIDSFVWLLKSRKSTKIVDIIGTTYDYEAKAQCSAL